MNGDGEIVQSLERVNTKAIYNKTKQTTKNVKISWGKNYFQILHTGDGIDDKSANLRMERKKRTLFKTTFDSSKNHFAKMKMLGSF